jgi:hypothetical protein
MMLGMTLSTFTLFHVVISVIGIGSGLLVMYELLIGKRLDGATAISQSLGRGFTSSTLT